MKNKIIATKEPKTDSINFYLQNGQGRFYLYQTKFSQGVYSFFRNGRSESELRNYNSYCRNPKLDHTVETLPKYVDYIMRHEYELVSNGRSKKRDSQLSRTVRRNEGVAEVGWAA